MKPKIKYIILLILFGGSISFISYHYKNLRCVFIHQNKNYIEVQNDVFVSKNTPQEFIDSLVGLLNKSNKELSNFWGNLTSAPTIIYCHTSKDYQKFGAANTLALSRLGKYVVFSHFSLWTDIINHELCHAEVFSRIGENYIKYYGSLPCWLDEGIALQFDSRNIYNIRDKEPYFIHDKAELKQLDRPKKFYSRNLRKTKENYIKAKIEVERFIEKNTINALIDILEHFKNGGDLYGEYYELRVGF